MNLTRVSVGILLVFFVGILGLFVLDSTTALAGGFDFPLGKPDHVGYGVAGLGGLDFLDPHDYGGNCGFTFHPGEDWNADGSGLDVGGDGNDAGDPVYAAANGTITYAQLSGDSWGFVVLIQHDGNYTLPEGGHITRVWSQYGHLANTSVNPRTGVTWTRGDVVLRGEQIGRVGDFRHGSGQAFHLHFEIRKADLPGSFFPCRRPRTVVELWYTRPSTFILENRPVFVESTFDTGTDGWSCVNDCANVRFNATGGNPGGFISADDLRLGPRWFWRAPPKFLGNKSSAMLGTLSFGRSQTPGAGTSQRESMFDVQLTNGTTWLTFDVPGSPAVYPQWTSTVVPLDATAGWKVVDGGGVRNATQDQLLAVLSSLTGLFIAGEHAVGADTDHLDNVRLRGP